MFNPYGVPETHEEVVAHFENFPDKFMGECMLGIYKCRLAKGEDVMLAYENALRASIGKPAIESPQQSVRPTLLTPRPETVATKQNILAALEAIKKSQSG